MPGSNRSGANAILLSNGKVLLAGGSAGSSPFKSAIIFDATTNSWSSVSSQMQTEHYLNAAIVTLNDGRVLIAGGQTVGGESVSKTDIFDPATNTFSAGPELSQPRQGLTAHVLTDGKVVFIGGGAYETTSNTVDVYDPVTSQIIRQFNTMSYSRYEHSSALLLERKDRIIGYWEEIRSLEDSLFQREAETLLILPSNNCQNALFGQLAASIEMTALQRGVGRWTPS
jgi:hypothetical protein